MGKATKQLSATGNKQLREHYCYICDTDLVRSKAMNDHNNAKHKNIFTEGVTEACPVCETWCPTKTDLIQHNEDKHKEGWEPHRNTKKVKKSKKEKAEEKKKKAKETKAEEE